MSQESRDREFPQPAVPIGPVLSFGSFIGGKPSLPSILDAGQSVWFTSGRMAIAAAIKHMGLGPGDKVLVPTYHCTSMVDPILWASVEPVFYRIKENLSVDLDDVREKCDRQTRCILITHYFGFFQDIERIRKFCDQNGLLLLEDCAHAFFGQYSGRPVGSMGDYAIASSIKFFPIYDGGCLVSTRELRGIKQVQAGLSVQARAAILPLEKSVRYGRLQPFNLLLRIGFGTLNAARTALKKIKRRNSVNAIPDAVNGGYGFDPKWVNVGITFPSYILMRKLISSERIIRRRRQYFTKMASAFKAVPGCKVLFDGLDASIVPYVFPLVIENHQQVFYELKMQGVPIYRWEDLRGGGCEVSRRYSQQLLQFPCHQELSNKELDWIIQKTLSAIRKATPSNAVK